MKTPNPTPSELLVLQILWTDGPSTVKHVHEKLEKTKDVGYTTTLKIMQIMHEKNILARDEKGKSHIYSALIEENAIQKRLIDKILDSAFGGSASQLIMQTLGNHKTSRKELEEIRKLLDQLDKKK